MLLKIIINQKKKNRKSLIRQLLKDIIRNNKVLIVLLSLYFITGLFLLFFFQRGVIELFVNKYHNVYTDNFFVFVTYLGDGGFLMLIVLLIAFRQVYYGLLAFLVFISSTIIVQSMKRILFADYPRPSKFFETYLDLHYVEGLDLHSFFSFPSGHSSGAFSIFILLALISRNDLLAVLFFSIAFLVSISRIYLMQHFFIDTYFGSLIGASVAFILFYFIHYHTLWPEKKILRQSLFTIFKK